MAQRKKHLWKAPEHLKLTQSTYVLGVNWYHDGKVSGSVDLDLQAVIVDTHGMVVDAVYFNNLEALDGAIGSGGDHTEGDHDTGMDEYLWIMPAKIPEEIQLIYFVLAAYNHKSLRDVSGGNIVLAGSLAECVSNPQITMQVEQSYADADVIGVLKKTGTKHGGWAWTFMEVDEPADFGSHFLDILEPTIGDLIRKEIPSAPIYQRVCFAMKKGAVAHFQGASTLKRLSICLDADVAATVQEAVDIDIAVVFYSEDGHCLGAVDSVNDTMFGVAHSGEIHYKPHEHTEESLSIDLAEVPTNVKHMFLVLTVMSGTFEDVEHVHIRIEDQCAHELATYTVPAGHKESGLIVARMFDTNSRLAKRWGVHAVASFFTQHPATWHGAKAKHLMLHHLHQESPDKVADPDHHHKVADPDHHHKKHAGHGGPQVDTTTSISPEAEAVAVAEALELPEERDQKQAVTKVPKSRKSRLQGARASCATSPKILQDAVHKIALISKLSPELTDKSKGQPGKTMSRKKGALRIRVNDIDAQKATSETNRFAADVDGVCGEVPVACAEEADAQPVAKVCNSCSWSWLRGCPNSQ